MSSVLSTALYASLSRNKLIDLCRSNKVSGFSHKSSAQLIDLLINAGVSPTGVAIINLPAAPQPPTEIVEVKETKEIKEIKETKDAKKRGRPPKNSTIPTNEPNHYIFNSHWKDVIMYLEDDSIELILAEITQQESKNEQWIIECQRTLKSNGTFIIRGISTVPTINAKSTWISVGDEKLLCITKGNSGYSSGSSNYSSISEFYTSLINCTATDSTVLVPFAKETSTITHFIKSGRSCILIEDSDTKVKNIYGLL